MLLYLVALAGGLSVVAVLLIKEFKSQTPSLKQSPLNTKGQLPNAGDESALKVEPLDPEEIKSVASSPERHSDSTPHLTLKEMPLQNDSATSHAGVDKTGVQKLRPRPDDKAHFLKDALKLGSKRDAEIPREDMLAEKLAEMDRLTGKIKKLEELLEEKNKDLDTVQQALEVENHNRKEFDVVKQALDDQIQDLRSALKEVKTESDKHKQEADFYKRKVALVEEELREKHLELKQMTARLEEIQKKTTDAPADIVNDVISDKQPPQEPSKPAIEEGPAPMMEGDPSAATAQDTPEHEIADHLEDGETEDEAGEDGEPYEADEPLKLRKDPLTSSDNPTDIQEPTDPSPLNPPEATDTDTSMP